LYEQAASKQDDIRQAAASSYSTLAGALRVNAERQALDAPPKPSTYEQVHLQTGTPQELDGPPPSTALAEANQKYREPGMDEEEMFAQQLLEIGAVEEQRNVDSAPGIILSTSVSSIVDVEREQARVRADHEAKAVAEEAGRSKARTDKQERKKKAAELDVAMTAQAAKMAEENAVKLAEIEAKEAEDRAEEELAKALAEKQKGDVAAYEQWFSQFGAEKLRRDEEAKQQAEARQAQEEAADAGVAERAAEAKFQRAEAASRLADGVQRQHEARVAMTAEIDEAARSSYQTLAGTLGVRVGDGARATDPLSGGLEPLGSGSDPLGSGFEEWLESEIANAPILTASGEVMSSMARGPGASVQQIKEMEQEQAKRRAEHEVQQAMSQAAVVERRRARQEKNRKQKLVDAEMDHAATRQAEENAAKLAAIEAKESEEQAEHEAAAATAAAAAAASAAAMTQYREQMGAYSAVLAAAEEEGRRRAREAFFLSVPNPTVQFLPRTYAPQCDKRSC
jgi:hypothetical protein